MSEVIGPAERSARLDSWKEIAAYLKRDVTTVQRWERREGLPVHRQRHERQGSVYAFVHELDRWAELRQVSPAPPISERLRRRWPVSAAVVLAISVSVGVGAYWRQHHRLTDGPAVPLDIAIPPPASGAFGRAFALSPDGRQLAVIVRSGNDRSLWVRDVYSRSAVRLTGTEGAHHPFWSPDGHQIGYFAEGSLKAVSTAGEPPRTICAAPGGVDAAWGTAGTIVFSREGRGLSAVPAAGGMVKSVTTVKPEFAETGHLAPLLLPDRRHLLFLSDADSRAAHAIWIVDLEDGRRKRLMEGIMSRVFLSNGHLLYIRNGGVQARPFDTARLALTGEEFLVIGDVRDSDGDHTVGLSVSASGALAFWPAEARRTRLTWYDENGDVTGYAGIVAEYETPSIAPDGRQIAVTGYNRAEANRDIWIVNADGDPGRRLTQGPSNEDWPIWSPDGRFVVYASDRTGSITLNMMPSDGNGEETPLQDPGVDVMPLQWRPTVGLLFLHRSLGSGTWDLWIKRSIDAPGGPWRKTPSDESASSVSPDGRWIAFVSDQTGRLDLYVERLSPGERRPIRITRNGGHDPRWAPDRQALYYITSDDQLVRVALHTVSGEPDPSLARILFKLPPIPRQARVYDVGTEGRLLVNALSTTDTPGTIAVTTRWAAREGRN